MTSGSGSMPPKRSELAAAASLEARREPFVLATVVWSHGPTSGKQAAKALIHPDGRVAGWLGGACAEPTLVEESRRALREGRPRLVFLGFDGLPHEMTDEVTTVAMACESEGAMAVFLEPVLPDPLVMVVGRSPAVDVLARLIQNLGWEAIVVDDGGSQDTHVGVPKVVTTLDALGKADETSFIVVATQGHYDEAALERALATRAGYVGLVASRKRSDSVLEVLRDRGIREEDLARVHAPAGLDLGKVSHEEMAVAILAELVAVRASGAVGRGIRVFPEPETASDPVCGMTVEVATARYSSSYDDKTYFFCAAGCQRAFEADPRRYA